ncbi:amidase signature domain-containing protein [Cercophora samala]|uniref:Amidase signature domain-containing protein n=1 Tax=Cercophora samala TaxID=330535 RepID=A0AA39Z9I2_9PEZI|nr:amidase signature domain-containing protein [Cercophora samala]
MDPDFSSTNWSTITQCYDLKKLHALLEQHCSESPSGILVMSYLWRIDKYEKHLLTMIATLPLYHLVPRAAMLDVERDEGNSRGPLHGIPVLITDNIATGPDLPFPRYAINDLFVAPEPRTNADVVDLLLQAGAIILGNTAFNSPGGCPSACAVAVSAGFAHCALGTDIDGTLICTAGRAALYALKPTPGEVSQKGVDSFTEHLPTSFKGMKVVGLDPSKWRFSSNRMPPVFGAEEHMDAEISDAYDKILAGHLYKADTIEPVHFWLNGQDVQDKIRLAGLRPVLNAYFLSLGQAQVDLVKSNMGVKKCSILVLYKGENRVAG